MLHEHNSPVYLNNHSHSAPSSTPYPPSCWSQARWSSSDHPGGEYTGCISRKIPTEWNQSNLFFGVSKICWLGSWFRTRLLWWSKKTRLLWDLEVAACSTPNISRMKVNMFQQTLWNLSCKVWPNESSKASKWISQASNIRCYAMGRIILKCIQGNTMILFSLCLFWSLVWPWQAAELGNTGGQSASLLSSSCSYSCWWTWWTNGYSPWIDSLDSWSHTFGCCKITKNLTFHQSWSVLVHVPPELGTCRDRSENRLWSKLLRPFLSSLDISGAKGMAPDWTMPVGNVTCCRQVGFLDTSQIYIYIL